MIKKDVDIINKGRLKYIEEDGKIKKTKAWAGSCVALLYDFSMKNSVIPGKFGASVEKHNRIMRRLTSGTFSSRVLELAAGSGNMVEILSGDTDYVGIDISPSLLKKAALRFEQKGLRSSVFYVCPSEVLPFEDEYFDYCICALSLNFFSDIAGSIREAGRVLKPGGKYIGCVPVPERNKKGTVIRGELFSTSELKKIFENEGFDFKILNEENGVLLYFYASK